MLSKDLEKALRTELNNHKANFELPDNKVPLAWPTYGIEEIMELMDSLFSTRVTMGAKVQAFERQFADFVGSQHAIMVNSGSSANLLAVSALTSKLLKKPLKAGDEVICPAVTWPTTIYPFAQFGMVPVCVDMEPATFNISPDAIRKAITPKTRAVCVVPVLGNPCDMKAITDICREYNLVLIEDTCESLGSRYDGKACGTFGQVGTYSFFFSHHMTTIEGGMIVTDDADYADVVRMQRAHGWVRNSANKAAYEQKHKDIDPRFLFVDWGYNFRAADINAAFGLHQLKKLPEMNRQRRAFAAQLVEALKPLETHLQLPVETKNAEHTWFGFPFLVKETAGRSREQVMSVLEQHGIETRPIIGGNLMLQPAFQNFTCRAGSSLEHANRLHKQGIYIGTHPGMGKVHVELVRKALSAALAL